VVLLVDTAEPQGMIDLLISQKVPFCRRRLEIGDYTWVAVRLPPVEPGLWGQGHGGFGGVLSDCEVPEAMLPADEAVVLDCVVERKDVNDLAQSIVGKRYDSQKARLLQTHIQTRIFLIEGLGSEVHVPLPTYLSSSSSSGTSAATWEDRLRSASIESHVNEAFLPVRTMGPRETVSFLAHVSRHLAAKVSSKGVGGETALMRHGVHVKLGELQAQMLHLKHDISCSDLLRVMLSRAVGGLGPRASEALVHTYATLPELLDALDKCKSLSDCEGLMRRACSDAGCRMPPASAVRLLWSLFDGEQ
jgi:ERCC4-type nuclease